MSRRFQGGAMAEILNASTVLNQDMIQVRHSVGTENDSDKALPLSVIQSAPVAVCETEEATAEKVATVSNFQDFTLLNGRDVICYMANGNTAENPTFNLNNSGAIVMEKATWQAGTFLRLKYVDIAVGDTRIQRWLVEAGAENTTKQIAISEENTNSQITTTKTDLESQIADTDVGAIKNRVSTLETSIVTVETNLNTTKSDLESSISQTKSDLESSISTTKSDLESSISTTNINWQGATAGLSRSISSIRSSDNEKLEKPRRQKDSSDCYYQYKIIYPGLYLILCHDSTFKTYGASLAAVFKSTSGSGIGYSFSTKLGGTESLVEETNLSYYRVYSTKETCVISVLKLCGETDDFIGGTYS